MVLQRSKCNKPWGNPRKKKIKDWFSPAEKRNVDRRCDSTGWVSSYQSWIQVFFLKFRALVSPIFIVKALKSQCSKCRASKYMGVYIFSFTWRTQQGEHSMNIFCWALLTEAEAAQANKFNMQIEVLMNQPSVLFASVGEIQYGRHRKSMQLAHLKHSEILKLRPVWVFCIHFCYSPPWWVCLKKGGNSLSFYNFSFVILQVMAAQ